MSINETHAKIKASIQESITQSGIDVSRLEKSTLNNLIDLIIDVTMEEIDAQIDAPLSSLEEGETEDVIKTAVANDILEDNKEDILWQGRPYLSMVESYTITDERIRITSGLLGKSTENIELGTHSRRRLSPGPKRTHD
ncbi:MAG: hypothetical protein M5U34_02305 [Chloroflexi bacterium]|nr:hypothetical protein [Chloroflexota bacterium]